MEIPASARMTEMKDLRVNDFKKIYSPVDVTERLPLG